MLFALEFGVAFLQAYVFVVLLAIYLRDSLYTAEH
jgi:F0F1-type ATP synthase membrane subunit a